MFVRIVGPLLKIRKIHKGAIQDSRRLPQRMEKTMMRFGLIYAANDSNDASGIGISLLELMY